MRTFIRLVFIICWVLNSAMVHAQTELSVQTISKDDGVAIPFIYINVYSLHPEIKKGTTLTDDNGMAKVLIDSFPIIIEAVGPGYDMERMTLAAKSSKTIQIKVSKNASTLNEVVVTGVLNPIKPMDAFSNYKVITSSAMQAMGAVNVQDAIGYQLNTVTNNDGVLGAQIRMQGMNGSEVKILMDGVPINGREDGNIDLGQLNTYNLERIEIIQGPMSVMYGTDALGGVINLISKNSKQKKLGISGETYYETVGKYNFNATATKSFGNHHFALGGGRNYFSGNGILSDDTASYGPHRTSVFKPKEQYLGNFNYSFNASKAFNLRFASDFLKEKVINRGIANVNSEFANAADDYYRVTRSINRLSVNGKFKNGGSYQLINGYTIYHRTKNTYIKDLVTLNETLSTAAGMQDTTTFNEFNFRGMYENKLFEKLNYTVGYDVDLQKGNGEKIPGAYKIINDYAAFTNISYPLVKDKLDVQGGLRIPYNTVYKAPVIPSFNLLYKCTPEVRVRASYARGFRAPGLKELYLDFVDQNHEIFGNPNLKAEIGDHVQASVSWMVFEKESNYAQVLLTGYYNNVHNQIALAQRYPGASGTQAQYYDYTNILQMRNTIATLEFEGQYSNFHYKLGYSYSYTFAQPDQYKGFDAHEITTTAQYYWKKSKLNISIFNRLNGARPFLQSNIDGTSTYIGRQPVYDMMDASVSRKLWKQKLQLTAGVKNIWNVTSFTAGSTTSSAHSSNGTVSFMPRSFFTSLRFNIN